MRIHGTLSPLLLRPLLAGLLLAGAPGCQAPGAGEDDSAVVDANPGARVDLAGFQPRNVVVVHIDTLRADALPRWGSAHETMPILGQRAGWVSVERAVSTASWTAPATASLLSGTDQPTHGIRFFDETGPNIPLAVPSYVPHLQEQGLTTALVTGSEILMGGVYNLGQGFGYAQALAQDPGNARGSVEIAIDWLDTLGADEPFLLFLQPMDVHGPYRPEDSDIGLWADIGHLPFVLTDPPAAQEAQIAAALEAATTDEARAQVLATVRDVYDEQMLGVDRAIGALMDALEAEGRLDETLIVLAADHGESFYDGAPPHLGHGMSVRNELVHVPLMFWGPGVTDAHVPCVASNMDIFPTIVDAMGLPALPSAEGRSLLHDCREHAFSGVYDSVGGVETLEYLSVESKDAQVVYDCINAEIHAYDLVADPLATVKLPLDSVPKGIVLADALDAYAASVVTTLPKLTCTVR
ncbi:MAG: sulfatase [Pseudomonadota bacterium]|nr:sulfatase [Pseudomonadota bacterium]